MMDTAGIIVTNTTLLLLKVSNMTVSSMESVTNTSTELMFPYDVNSSLGNLSSGAYPEPYVYPIIRQPVHMIVIYSLAYGIVFLLGIFGNSLVVSVVYRNPRMHNVTNYFIVNLAIADILVCLLCLPITLLSNLFSGWRLGAVMCKVTPFLQGLSVSASCSTLTAIALERYCAICHVLEFRLTRKLARLIIMVIWVSAGCIMVPWAVYYQQREYPSPPDQPIHICNQFWPTKTQEKGYFLGVIFLTCYTIPLILISGCYSFIGYRVWNRNAPGVATTNQVIYKSKVKALKMLIVVVILFAFSWLPLYAVNVRLYFGPELLDESTEFFILSQIVVPVSQWLGLSNSCVNPLIYCFFSKKFRRGFQELIHCWKGGISRNSYFNRNNSATYQTYHSVHAGQKPAQPINSQRQSPPTKQSSMDMTFL